MVGIEFQAFQQIGAHQLLAQPLTLQLQRIDHAVGPHPLQHLHVDVAVGPGDHLFDAAAGGIFGDQRGGDAGFDRAGDGHHNGAHLQHASFPHGFFIGAVHQARFDRRFHLAQLINGPLFIVDGQHLGAPAHQLLANRQAKAAQADHRIAIGEITAIGLG